LTKHTRNLLRLRELTKNFA